MSNSEKIRQEAQARGIKHLVHFTPAANARSILSNGLASRPILKDHGISYVWTDGMRSDEKLNAISVSIGEVNYAMFHQKRKDYYGQWVVFVLDPSILWTHDCRFCWMNAAKAEIRDHHGFLGGPWGFRRMFEGKPVGVRDTRCQREVYNLDSGTPYDNAAEVQVSDTIDSDLVLWAGVQTRRQKADLEEIMIEVDHMRPVEVAPHFFI